MDTPIDLSPAITALRSGKLFERIRERSSDQFLKMCRLKTFLSRDFF